MTAALVLLLDVDNTLLDNDRVVADLRSRLERDFGAATVACYERAFEALRREFGFADYLGALQRFRAEIDRDDAGETDAAAMARLLSLSNFLIDYPFADRLVPRSLDLIAHLGRWGPTVILSDGDAVFQPHKLRRSGLWQAVHGRVLIFVHKEQRLATVQRCYPARRYVMVDDKLRLLAAMKAQLGARLLTVFVRQGHYAHDAVDVARHPAADLSVDHVGDLLGPDFEARLNTFAEAP